MVKHNAYLKLSSSSKNVINRGKLTKCLGPVPLGLNVSKSSHILNLKHITIDSGVNVSISFFEYIK